MNKLNLIVHKNIARFWIACSVFMPSLLYAANESAIRPNCKGLVCCTGPDCDFKVLIYNIGYIIEQVLTYSFVLIALMVAYAGYLYMTSGSDSGRRQEAHEMFAKVVKGILIVLLAFSIVELVTSSLGLDTNIIELIK